MKRTVFVFIITPMYLQAQILNCPFKASDPNAIALASTTAGTIQGLLDAKNQCSASFTEAVKSVNGLPTLLNAVKDPLRELEAKRYALNTEIARALTEMQSTTDPSTQSSYSMHIDNKMLQKLEVESQIVVQTEKRRTRIDQKERSQEDIISMTWNLISASSNAMSDPNSPCAKNISKNYGGEILTLGMGAVSSAGYLISSAAGGGITIAAGLMSKVVELFNRMPPDVLEKFQNQNQTLDMACLYHNIVNISCEMKDNTLGKTKTVLEEETKKIKDRKLYAKFSNTYEVKDDLVSAISAVVTQDISVVSTGTGAGVDKELMDTFSTGSAMNEKDEWERVLRQYELLKKYIISDKAAFDKLSPQQKAILSNGINGVVVNVATQLEAEGISIRNSNGMINYQEIFRTHYAVIEKVIKSNILDQKGNSENNYATVIDLHRGINIKKNQDRNRHTRDTYKEIKEHLESTGADKTSDGKSLIAQMAESLKVLDAYDNWMKVDQEDPEYKTKINVAAQELKQALKPRRDDNHSLRERVKEVLNQPLNKFDQMMSEGKSVDQESIFANPLKPSKSAMSDFSRYKALRSVYSQSVDQNAELNDRNLVNETRRLFEGEDSLLRKNFFKGLVEAKEQIASSPDPEIKKQMVMQLCGLAYAFPSSGEHAINECKDMIPANMRKHMKQPKETPDCTYYRYSKSQLRTESFETGRTPKLPGAESSNSR